jgi:hypothetical protein
MPVVERLEVRQIGIGIPDTVDDSQVAVFPKIIEG